jgi:TatD DNase family protein
VSSEEQSPLTDTHCHLDFDAFDGDRAEILEHARMAGIHRILNPGLDLSTSQAALNLAGVYPEVYAAVGIHPNEANSFTGDAINNLSDMIFSKENQKLVAVGEIGLDYYWDKAPRGLQRQVFLYQLDLAARAGLPVVIHSRQALHDTLEILSDWQNSLKVGGAPLAEHPGVLHSFEGDLGAALRAVELNFFIGITGPVTFKNSPVLQEVAANLPLDRILVETDSPFLTPHPHRGKRNEPAYIPLIIDKIAAVQNRTFSDIATAVWANARKLFNW